MLPSKIFSENNYIQISTRNTKQHQTNTTKTAARLMGHVNERKKEITSRYTKVALKTESYS
jgi:hypothetical protein